MIICGKCKSQNPDNAQFCNSCGAKLVFSSNMNNKNSSQTTGIWSIIGILFLFFLFYVIFFTDLGKIKVKDLVGSGNNNEVLSPSTEIVKETEKKSEKSTCKKKLAKHIGKKTAKEIIDVLKQAGFIEFEYIEKMEGLNNFQIQADDYCIWITAFDDGIERIWKDSHVIYEDGKIIETKEDIDNSTISFEEKTAFEIIAKEIIDENLKNSTFSSYSDIGMAKNGNLVAVSGKVKAKNDFNTKVTEEFLVEFTIESIEIPYSYTVNYIKIGNQQIGEYIKIE